MTNDIQSLRRILETCKVIAVVGLSADETRPSYGVAKYLIDHGYTVIPVNPRYGEILDRKCYPSLREAAANCGTRIDMVDCFRRSEDIVPICDEAIAIGARVLWQQLGVANMEAARKAEAAGLDSVVDRCVKIEHARLFGGQN